MTSVFGSKFKMIGQDIMKQESFGKKTATKLLVAAALSAAFAPAAWAKAGDYTPLGIKNGPFTIFLNSTIGIQYDDNVFALADPYIAGLNGAGLDEDDFVGHIKLGAEARGKFSGGSTLDLYTGSHFGGHFEYDEKNFIDGKIGLKSRTFFSKAVSLRAKSEYSYEHEDFGFIDTLAGGTPGDEPVTLSKLTGALALDFKPGRTGFTIGADAVGRLYNDQELAGGGSRSVEHRDYWDVNFFAEFTQDLDKTTGFFLRANGNGRAYPDRTPTPAVVGAAPYNVNTSSPGLPNRDSLGFDVTAGARVKASGTINLEAYAGYINKEFDDSQFDTINDFIFGANMKWTPSAFFEMKVLADRSILETTDSLNSSFVASKAETTLSIFPLENLTFWTTGRYINRDYQPSTFSQGFKLPEREDDVFFAEIGGEFKINRNIGLGLHYNYQQRESSMSNDARFANPNPAIDLDFDRQKVMFEVKLAR